MKTRSWSGSVFLPLVILLPILTFQNREPTIAGGEQAPAQGTSTHSPEELNDVVQKVCANCHNGIVLDGNLSLTDFDVTRAPAMAETAEKMIVKLRAGMMPPPGRWKVTEETRQSLAAELENRIDKVAAANPNPGHRPFQRLNRAEYESSVRELLALNINAGDYLPLDTKSANFDNIADAQMLSATVMAAYLRAAAEISRLAVGDPNASIGSKTYTNPGYTSQWDRVEGAPRGTRGGISVVHNFPADGDYVFKLAFEHTTTGGFFGRVTQHEQIEVSANGSRIALLDVDRWMHVSDPNGVNMKTEPIFMRAGPQQISAAFLRRFEGPVEDLLSPHDWSLTDRQIGVTGYGVTSIAHLKDLVIEGPENPKGVSETISRQKIFSCRPTSEDPARACARQIVSRLGAQAYRRPLRSSEVSDLLAFYDQSALDAGFEMGIRTALQAILASPDFVFRFEEPPAGVGPGQTYRIGDLDLASRLSFFLWGTPPDPELLRLATENLLSVPDQLEAQVYRMLGDPRSQALARRFAAQWLRLDDVDKVHPDRLLFPDYHQQLADAMKRETELLFNHLVQADGSLLDLFTADYTFLNQRLARHYGIPGVTGESFRRVSYPDTSRRGLLGHGSILTLTSHANRTSPVLRGRWVLEVLIGIEPPPPPPGIPDLEETEASHEGRMLTTRERMELHRKDPTCNSCHQYIDPIGLALDNFDVTGRWRIKENGIDLDTYGEMFDGTPVASPADLLAALLQRPTPLLRTFTENLMAYALGRRIEYHDKPTVRAIVRQATENDYRVSSFILGVVSSPAFQSTRAPDLDPEEEGGKGPTEAEETNPWQ